MNIGKGIADMKDMMSAAPGLIEGAQQLAANAQANAQAFQQSVAAPAPAEPQPGNLEPVAGVSLELYARVAKGIAAYNYDQSKLVDVAATLGITPGNWQAAQAVWSTRVQSDPAIASRFNQFYTAS